jgi:hypothetical protein
LGLFSLFLELNIPYLPARKEATLQTWLAPNRCGKTNAKFDHPVRKWFIPAE